MSTYTRLPSSRGRTESFQENYPGVISHRRRSPRKCPGQSNCPCLSWGCLFLTTPNTREPWAHTLTVTSQEDQVTTPITQRRFTEVGNIHTQKELSQKMLRKLPAGSINCTKKAPGLRLQKETTGKGPYCRLGAPFRRLLCGFWNCDGLEENPLSQWLYNWTISSHLSANTTFLIPWFPFVKINILIWKWFKPGHGILL